MDEQKKRLYDLIVDAENEFYRDTPTGTDSERIEKTVDYLLENGVLAPPCKVGDTVWMSRLKDEICEGNVCAIKRFRDSRYPLWLEIEYEDEIEGIRCYNARADMVGKSIFLTRE